MNIARTNTQFIRPLKETQKEKHPLPLPSFAAICREYPWGYVASYQFFTNDH